jgi:hypothetical protein
VGSERPHSLAIPQQFDGQTVVTTHGRLEVDRFSRDPDRVWPSAPAAECPRTQGFLWWVTRRGEARAPDAGTCRQRSEAVDEDGLGHQALDCPADGLGVAGLRV